MKHELTQYIISEVTGCDVKLKCLAICKKLYHIVRYEVAFCSVYLNPQLRFCILQL